MSRFDFPNANGRTLTGRLELPLGQPRGTALFAHCFTCSKNVRAATVVARELAARGVAVLRFDFTGLGNSEGDFANTNFSSNVGDLVAAASALAARYESPSLLVGHSLGGAAALMAAGRIESVRAVATIGAPSEPAHVEHLFGDRVAAIEEDGAARVEIGGRELTIERQFLEDLRANVVAEALPELRKPVLILHSPIDSIVSIDNARRLYEAARHPKSFVSLDGADHLLSRPDDGRFVGGVIAAWAERYLVDDREDEPVVERLAKGVVEVRDVDGRLGHRVRAGRHEIAADEPIDLGGQDTGLNPYELLLASLGACTAITLRMYANRKDWPLESVRIRLSHDRVHAEDCAECETVEGFVDTIAKAIVVTGPLDETQVARLGEIADRCPVHRTLLGEVRVSSDISRA